MHGFHANGFLDPRFNRLPVMKNIIGTCKKIPTIGEYPACVKALPSPFKYCWNNGNIPDNICEQHGIPQDKDINGVVCR